MADAKRWLTDQLVKTLGWEATEAGALVDAIADATPAERNGIVEVRLGTPSPNPQSPPPPNVSSPPQCGYVGGNCAAYLNAATLEIGGARSIPHN